MNDRNENASQIKNEEDEFQSHKSSKVSEHILANAILHQPLKSGVKYIADKIKSTVEKEHLKDLFK